MDVNSFLKDLNAEGEEFNASRGLAGLENLVAIAFDEDSELTCDPADVATVVPGLSAHWATLAPGNASEIVPLHQQPLYREDWIGLKELEKKGKLVLAHCPGQHMEIGGEGGCGDQMVRKWIGWKV